MSGENEKAYFTEADSAEVVMGSIDRTGEERLLQIMDVVIRHLHAAVKEIEPTQEEWFQAIQFLTKTGQMSDEWRQEFILLSDILGVSMLVDAINNRKPGGATETTVLGPFHVENAPLLENGADTSLEGKGEPLVVHGKVRSLEGAPIEGASLDVWQCNDDGFYDVQQKGIQPDFNLRGIFHSQKDGGYWFRAVKPRPYPIPDDGPVGMLLKKLGRHPNRPAHLHYIVGADGYEEITTHIFVPDDIYIDSDAVFGVKESLLADFIKVDDPVRAEKFNVANPFWEVEFDFVLAPKSG